MFKLLNIFSLKTAWLVEKLKYSQIFTPLSNKRSDCTGTLLACREGQGWLFWMCSWKHICSSVWSNTSLCSSDVNVHSMCIREIVVFLALKYHHLWNKIELARRRYFIIQKVYLVFYRLNIIFCEGTFYTRTTVAYDNSVSFWKPKYTH